MLAALGGQLGWNKLGIILIKNSSLGAINSCAIYKVKKDLTIGFGSYGFVYFGTCTFVAFQLLAPATAYCCVLPWKFLFPVLAASPLTKIV